MIAKLEGHTGLERKNMSAPEIIEPTRGISGEEVSWTPDSKYVLGGSLDGKFLSGIFGTFLIAQRWIPNCQIFD